MIGVIGVILGSIHWQICIFIAIMFYAISMSYIVFFIRRMKVTFFTIKFMGFFWGKIIAKHWYILTNKIFLTCFSKKHKKNIITLFLNKIWKWEHYGHKHRRRGSFSKLFWDFQFWTFFFVHFRKPPRLFKKYLLLNFSAIF